MTNKNLVVDGDFREAVALGSATFPVNTSPSAGSETYTIAGTGSPWSAVPGQFGGAVYSPAALTSHTGLVLPDVSLQGAIAFSANSRTRIFTPNQPTQYFTSAVNTVPNGVRLTAGGHIEVSFWIYSSARYFGLSIARNFGTGSSTSSDTIFAEIIPCQPGQWKHVVKQIACRALTNQDLEPGDFLSVQIFFDAVQFNGGNFFTGLTPLGSFSNPIQLPENSSGNVLCALSGLSCEILDRSADPFEYVHSQAGGFVGYKRYVALLTQSGTAAPVATVLENSIGNIVWTRSAPGTYLATLTGAFPSSKTWVVVNAASTNDGADALVYIQGIGVNQFELVVSNPGAPDMLDDEMVNTPLEIRVYS